MHVKDPYKECRVLISLLSHTLHEHMRSHAEPVYFSVKMSTSKRVPSVLMIAR